MKNVYHKIIATFKLLFTGMIDLVYPPLCLLCEKRLDQAEEQVCLSCLDNFILLGKPHQQFSVPGKIYLNTAWALFEFDAAFQSLIHHLKYSRRRKPVLAVLDHYQPEVISQLSADTYDLIISIPLHPRKLRERGYNQVDGMSGWLSGELGARMGNQLVMRTKYTQTQTKLNAEERQQNVASAFAVKHGSEITGQRVLLVDDVLTTGATANSLARVLKQAGAVQVDLVTLSTPKHGE